MEERVKPVPVGKLKPSERLALTTAGWLAKSAASRRVSILATRTAVH